jgi:hypothetical protein
MPRHLPGRYMTPPQGPYIIQNTLSLPGTVLGRTFVFHTGILPDLSGFVNMKMNPVFIFLILGASCRASGAAGPGYPLVSFCLLQKGYRFYPLRLFYDEPPGRYSLAAKTAQNPLKRVF